MKHKGKWMGLLALCVACAVVSFCLLLGATTAKEELVGVDVPLTLTKGQTVEMLARPYGGYALLCQDETETALYTLTQQGKLEDISYTVAGQLQQRTAGETALAFATLEQGTTQGSVFVWEMAQPLTKGQQTLVDYEALGLLPASICVDGEEQLVYGLSEDQKAVHRVSLAAMEQETLWQGEQRLQSLSLVGNTLYAKEEGTAHILQGDTVAERFAFASLGKQAVTFPLQTVGEDLLADSNQRVYRITEQGLLPVGKEALPSFADGNEGFGVYAKGNMLVCIELVNGTEIGRIDCSGAVLATTYTDGMVTALVQRQQGLVLVTVSDGVFFAENPQKEAVMAMPTEKERNSVWYSDNYTIDVEKGILLLPEETTLAVVKQSLSLTEGQMLTATRADGKALTSGKVGTGTTLQLTANGDVIGTITVVTLGDSSGNGLRNTTDVKALYQHLTQEKPLSEYPLLAMDIDQDGTVDTRDLLLLKNN